MSHQIDQTPSAAQTGAAAPESTPPPSPALGAQNGGTASTGQPRKVFVSGCYDIIHGGHIEFFAQARSMGDYLIVCFAGERSLRMHKNRKSSLPVEHKKRLLESLTMVDEVVVGDDEIMGLDFTSHFLASRPSMLVVTEDDRYGEQKRQLCQQVGAEYVILPKTLDYEKISTSEIIQYIKAPHECPLRVDFGGGWLDVPKYARPGAYIVNCAIAPLVSLREWKYEIGGGLGGSAAYALMMGKNPVEAELDLGVGWQDPVVIQETGLCVWRSGARPSLEFKSSGAFLRGHMALQWTGKTHTTYENTDIARDYDLVERAGAKARQAVLPGQESISTLAEAIELSYQVQLGEGMDPLPTHRALARKYCGGGWGGYALYLFAEPSQRDAFLTLPDTHLIEPYMA